MALLENKVSIVTGGSRGIGEAIALKLAENGSHIAFTYLSSDDKAKALEKKLKSFGVNAKAYKSNAGNYEDCETMVNDVVKEFGTVDICVNNAGISRDNLLLRMTSAQWDEVMNTNLKSVFNMTKQVIRLMMKSKKGSIINMSSIPEAKLAREAEICYAVICMSTDYDCWHESEEDVTIDIVINNMNTNSANAKKLVQTLAGRLGNERNCGCKEASKFAIITAPEKRNIDQAKKLSAILPEYFK